MAGRAGSGGVPEQLLTRPPAAPPPRREPGAARVNFLPSGRDEDPIIGKRSGTWRRRRNGQQTHLITGHHVRRVLPIDPLPDPLAVTHLEVGAGAGGTSVFHTAAPHSFSGAKQVVTIGGLRDDLDGNYGVWSASGTEIKIKLPRQNEQAAAGLVQAVASGGVTVREEHTLDNSWELQYFMVTEEAAEQPQPPPQQPQVPAPAQPGPQPAGPQLPNGIGEPHPADVFNPMPLQDPEHQAPFWGAGFSGFAAAASGGTPLPSFPLTSMLAAGMPAGVPPGGHPASPAASQAQGEEPAGSGLGQSQAGSGLGGSQQQQQVQQQEQQAEYALQAQQQQQQPQPPGSPAASSGLVPSVPPPQAGEHAQREGHYSLLTAGSERPVAGRGEFADRAFVTLGNAEVTGHLRTQGFEQISDARAKEQVRLFDEAEKAVSAAASISTYLYSYKGQSAQRLGVLAQEVRQSLEEAGLEHLNIVREDAQGLLSVDYGGMQTLLHTALKQALANVEELRAAQGSMQLAVMGRMEELSASVRELQAASGLAGGSAASAAAPAGSRGDARPRLSTASSGTGLAGAAGMGRVASQLSSLADELDEGDVGGEDVEMSSAGEEEGEGESAAAPAEPAAGEFEGLSDEQVLQLLLDRLCEQAGAKSLYKRFVSELSRPALWELYQQAVNGPREQTAAGDAQRTLGGQFIRLAKQRMQAEKLRRKQETVQEQPVQLRGYQQQLLAAAKQGGNHILVAPTASGKTAVAVALALHRLQQDASARVVFLAPTQSLALQQAAAFFSAPKFRRGQFSVACYTSDNLLAPRDWERALQDTHVLVMTPLFPNLLDAGAAHFDQISLLVIDECHHSKDKHPFAKILQHYERSARTTQILGLTASPAARNTLDATYADMRQLARNLHAEYAVLPEGHEELASVLPQTEQLEVMVGVAEQDASFGRRLGAFVVAAVELITAGLVIDDLPGLPAEVLSMLREGRWSRTAALWTVKVAESLQAAVSSGQAGGKGGQSEPAQLSGSGTHDAAGALRLVRAAVAALALVSDVGFEPAVRHLSQEYFAVASKQLAQDVEQEDVLSEAFRSGESTLSTHPKFQALKKQLLEYQGREAFHGIVFARTREAVRSITRLISASPDLQFLQAHAFMGHGKGKGSGSGASGGGGLNSKQQQAVMAAFRQPGRRLLVSTSAGEEGIDIPRCEFVIRFSATQTGRERVQSAGRARKLGSRFVEILEATPAELALVQKARREEHNMRQALEGLAGMSLSEEK